MKTLILTDPRTPGRTLKLTAPRVDITETGVTVREKNGDRLWFPIHRVVEIRTGVGS